MDAAHTIFKKTALFFAPALFVLAPVLKAQPVFNNPGTVTLNSGGGQVTITTSGAPVTYQATITALNPPAGDPTNWMTISSGSTGTTPTVMQFSLLNLGSVAGTFNATVRLHATDTSQAADISFTVQYVSGSTGGGGGGGGTTGTITASPTSVTLSSVAGSTSAPQATITLSTNNSSAVPFSVSYSPIGTWLQASTPNSFVTAGSNASITVVASAFSLNNNTYSGSITITPTSGTPTVVPVTFNVGTGGGSGSGTITATPNPVNWTYSSNSGTFPTQLVSLTTTTGATTYTATASSSNGWLSVTSGGTLGVNGLLLSTNGNINSLTTGVYQGNVSISDPNGGFGSISVNLNVNGGTTSGLTISPNNGLTFSGAVGSGSTSPQFIYVTSSISGSVSLNCSSTPAWLQCSGNPTSISANNQTAFTVSANASGLTNGTYVGQVAVVVTGNTTLSGSVPVSFVVGTGSGGGGSSGTNGFAAAPSSMVFSYQTGTPRAFVSRQTIGLTGTGNWTAVASTNNGSGWLIPSTLSSTFQGDGTSSTTVNIDPTGLSVGTYTGSVVITSNGVPLTVGITLNVVSAPVLLPTPGSVLYNFHTGDPALQPTAVFLSASDGSAVTATAATTTSWLTVAQTAGSTSFSITANPAGLAAGLYTGSVTVTEADLANSPMSVPVVLIVNGGTTGGGSGGSGNLSFNPTSMSFNAAVNGSSPAAQTLFVSAASSTSFSASTSTSSGGSWLSLSQYSGVTGTSAISISVFVNSVGLPLGTYNGTITFSANGATQTVSVLLSVTSTGTGGGGNVTANTSSLSFTGQAGSSNPAAQTLTLSSASGSAGVGVNIAAATTSGGNWLSVSPTSGTTQLSVSVSVSLAGLAAGTYNGTVTVSPSGGSQLSIPVSLTVSAAATVSASPSSLTFTYRAGDTAPAAQNISVTGGGASLTFTAAASSTGNWLTVTPTSGTTPAMVSVSINPASLNASPTPYTGTITVAGSGSATGTSTITVSLTVTAPLPTVSKITNAGSFATAAAVSPGEIITLFATDAQHPIGPSTAVGLTLDSTGKVATTIGGTQVLASGFACPMIYASATQISAVVPYEVAGFVFSGTDILVKYLGQTSNAVHVNVATTAPGLFTLNSSGTGPGAILNGNGSVNSSSNPASKGDTVVLYLTGEGQTTPAGVTGKVTTVASTTPLTPTPLLPISILIGPPGSQQSANYSFAGEAPGIVSGALQLNVQIPTTVSSGDLPIIVSIGSNSSQSGVTVSVK